MWQKLYNFCKLTNIQGISFTVISVGESIRVTGRFNSVIGPDSVTTVFPLLGWTRMAGLSSCCKGSVQRFVQSHRESQEYKQTPSDLLTASLRQNQILLYCTLFDSILHHTLNRDVKWMLHLKINYPLI